MFMIGESHDWTDCSGLSGIAEIPGGEVLKPIFLGLKHQFLEWIVSQKHWVKLVQRHNHGSQIAFGLVPLIALLLLLQSVGGEGDGSLPLYQTYLADEGCW